MSGSGLDPYGVLGVGPGATSEEIRASFRRIVRERHPDTAPDRVDDPSLRDVIDAYRMLIGSTDRARHDRPLPDDVVSGARRIPVRRAAVTRQPARASTAPCRACGASGMTKLVGRCGSCGGEGRFTLLSVAGARRKPCRDCRGQGQVVTVRRCERCAGTGVETAPDG